MRLIYAKSTPERKKCFGNGSIACLGSQVKRNWISFLSRQVETVKLHGTCQNPQELLYLREVTLVDVIYLRPLHERVICPVFIASCWRACLYFWIFMKRFSWDDEENCDTMHTRTFMSGARGYLWGDFDFCLDHRNFLSAEALSEFSLQQPEAKVSGSCLIPIMKWSFKKTQHSKVTVDFQLFRKEDSKCVCTSQRFGLDCSLNRFKFMHLF